MDEQAERDRIALQLDALLAICAVALAKEERETMVPPKRKYRALPPNGRKPVADHWLKKAS